MFRIGRLYLPRESLRGARVVPHCVKEGSFRILLYLKPASSSGDPERPCRRIIDGFKTEQDAHNYLNAKLNRVTQLAKEHATVMELVESDNSDGSDSVPPTSTAYPDNHFLGVHDRPDTPFPRDS